jgi:hypothetical protein
MSDKPRERKRNMKEALALFQKNGSKTPLPSVLQRYKDLQDGKEEESNIPASVGSKDIGQRVLNESFCVNRLAEIRRVAADARLRDFTDSAAPNSHFGEIG